MPNRTTLQTAAAVTNGYAEVLEKFRVLIAGVAERDHRHRSVDVQPNAPHRLGKGEPNAD